MPTTPRLVKSLTQVNTADAPAAPGGLAVQDDGQIARLADGGYVVVWADYSGTHNPEGAAIVGQRYDPLGNKVRGEVKISQFNDGSQSEPAITALPNGNLAIAYIDQFSGDFDIYVRIVGPGGASLSVGRIDTIDIDAAKLTTTPSITAFADGSYVISYQVYTGGDNDIVARIVSPTGSVGAQFDIDNQTDSRDLPQVATLSNGNFVVTYQAGGNPADVLYKIFTPAGTQVVAPTSTPGSSGETGEQNPDVAALKEGGFVIVWTDRDSDDPDDVRAAILSNVGSVVVDNILVNTTTTGDQGLASVVALADGGFLVTWNDDNANLVRAQRFDAAGVKIGTEFTVKNGTSGDLPEAALLTDGGRIAYAVTDISIDDNDVMTSIWRARDVSHDFDGDGKSGVLWRHDSGQVYFWEMNGLGVKAEGSVAHAPVPSDWHIQGAGDFDGDGNNDVLWRHDSGQVYFWEMDGLAVKAEGGVVHASVPNDWHIQGVGDFDGDGKSDILWRHDSGQVYIWEMNGLQVKAEGTVMHAPVGNDWHVEDIGDYNNDGKSGDILWRHDSGQVYTWEMNGLQITAEGGAPHAPVPSDWHIFSQHNFV